MIFAYPLFLWALVAISVPVAIHLFNFRRYKKVYFTNVKFLRELQQESKSRSRLKEILVLISRCLAIACLVLAFSQPFIPGDKQSKQASTNAVSIYIDNSFSMQNVNRQGPLLELAKTRAKEIVNAYANSDRFQIITNDFEGKHQRFNTKEDVITLIDEIKASAAVRNLSDVLKRQSEFLAGSTSDGKKIYVVSDAQKATFDLQNVTEDTLVGATLIPLTANRVNNVYVDSCWFESPLQQKGFIQKLNARIVNSGSNPLEVGSAKLIINKQQVAISSFSLGPESKKNIRFTFECKNEGFNFGSIKIEDYPITFDDELSFAFNSRINISVVLVNGKHVPQNNSFSSLFANDSLFMLRSISEQLIDYSAFRKADVLILNQLNEISTGLLSELVKFTAKGGALVIVPSPQVNKSLYNPALNTLQLPEIAENDTSGTKIEKLNLASGFYEGVFEKIDERLNLPVVEQHYKFKSGIKKDVEVLLSMQNSDIFLVASKFNSATVYLFSNPLSEPFTNFNKHALFVPTFFKLCFNSLLSPPLFYETSTNVIINVKNESSYIDNPPHIKNNEGSIDIIPELRLTNNNLTLFTRQQISKPGFYTITTQQNSLQPLAFNYSRKESDLKCYTNEELEGIVTERNFKGLKILTGTESGFSKQIALGIEGKKLWKLFLLLTLLFLLVETALLRLLK
ncbi:MAG: BatA and WFA domain-containing protein [Bacteroidia bacterium]|nr:BatA and WFA domain-containing protein [Bacteroidia bacterium]